MAIPADLLELAHRHVGTTAIPGLTIHKVDQVTDPEPLIYDPCMCLVLQGAKRLYVGGTMTEYRAASNLVIATELSALGQVVSASPDRPLLSVALSLDDERLADIMGKVEEPASADATGYLVEPASALEIEAWSRFLALLERPGEIPALAPPREAELLYRMLLSPAGKILRRLGSRDSGLLRVRQVMAYVRRQHSEPLEVGKLAERAGMSPTTFHRKFKSAAGLSPLQYQKRIRLHEAKRLLLAQTGSAASVAFQVGYESPSQFSREYRRLFGRPPSQDAAVARELSRLEPMA